MAEIFRSFIGGVEAGTQLRENRERRNALHLRWSSELS